MPPGSIEVWPDHGLLVLGLIRATVMWKPRIEVTQLFAYGGGVSSDQALGAVAQFRGWGWGVSQNPNELQQVSIALTSLSKLEVLGEIRGKNGTTEELLRGTKWYCSEGLLERFTAVSALLHPTLKGLYQKGMPS